jgi:hypothetical protein
MISSRVKGPRVDGQMVKSYFELCRSRDSERRKKFLDHGIMSALILLKAVDIQRYYLLALNGLAIAQELPSDPRFPELLRQDKTRQHLEEAQFYVRFAHVAAASALHNICPGLYSEEQCREFGLDRVFYPRETRSFGITMQTNPLSYLTALVDVLQDWDRHSFRAPAFQSGVGQPIAASEILIEVPADRDIVDVVPLSREAALRYRSHLTELREILVDVDTYVHLSDRVGLLTA